MNFSGNTFACIFPQYITGVSGEVIKELWSRKFTMKDTEV